MGCRGVLDVPAVLFRSTDPCTSYLPTRGIPECSASPFLLKIVIASLRGRTPVRIGQPQKVRQHVAVLFPA
jgi:hypothetical protein